MNTLSKDKGWTGSFYRSSIKKKGIIQYFKQYGMKRQRAVLLDESPLNRNCHCPGEVKSTHLFIPEDDSKKSYTKTKIASWIPHNEKTGRTVIYIYIAKKGDKIANHSKLTGKPTGYYK